jgi:hypothetical protein
LPQNTSNDYLNGGKEYGPSCELSAKRWFRIPRHSRKRVNNLEWIKNDKQDG